MSAPAPHTPGPWKNARRADGRPVCFHVTPQPATEHCAAEPADPEHVANMLLLDAAPDLLAALRDAVGCILIDRTALADAHTGPDGIDEDGAAGLAEYDAVLVPARAAIAKATGSAA